jgi:hypothetical protein
VSSQKGCTPRITSVADGILRDQRRIHNKNEPSARPTESDMLVTNPDRPDRATHFEEHRTIMGKNKPRPTV